MEPFERRGGKMSGLPPDGTWLIQQIGEQVILFHRYTEEEIVRFDPSDANAAAQAQKVINDSERLTVEQKCFAHFWSGYFYAHARRSLRPAPELGNAVPF
jgi:hypothetical protein